MKVEKLLSDAVCSCCLNKKSNAVRVKLSKDDIFVLCPSCKNKLINKFIKEGD